MKTLIEKINEASFRNLTNDKYVFIPDDMYNNSKNISFVWIICSDGFDKNNGFIGKNTIFYGLLTENDVKELDVTQKFNKSAINAILSTKPGNHYMYDNCNAFIRVK